MTIIAPEPAQTNAAAAATEPLYHVDDLAVSFDNGSGPRIQAVDGVRMSIFPRQTLAVVGESGCGKSVTAMSSLQLVPRPPGRFDRGRISFRRRGGDMVDLTALKEHEIRQIRGNEIAMIFQEPMTSLNPVYTVGDQILEAILLHQPVRHDEAVAIAVKAMTDVGIPDPEARLRAYPHQFSGGMRQRVMIAMALACQPRLLLADEPTTALDVTIQKQILDLLIQLKDERDMAVMLITHDLAVVAENADIVCVMYAGRIVEYADVFTLYKNPLHPYTRGLLESIPKIGERKDRLVTIREITEDPANFQRLPGHEKDLTPWWPWNEPPKGASVTDSAGADSCLVEVEPNHWVGCWKTPEAAAQQHGTPMLNFSRQSPADG